MSNIPSQSPDDEESASWPPAPGGPVIPDRRPGEQIFVSQRKIQRTLLKLAILAAAYSIWALVLGSRASSASLNILSGVIAIISLTSKFCMAIAFLVWAHGIYRNLFAFPDTTPSTTPGWMVGYYFIPVISLYKPYQLMNEVWQQSDPVAAMTGQKQGSSGLIVAWWLMFLLRSFDNLGNFNNVLHPELHASASTAGRESVFSLIEIVALILMLLVVRAVNNRQEAKEKALVEAWESRMKVGQGNE